MDPGIIAAIDIIEIQILELLAFFASNNNKILKKLIPVIWKKVLSDRLLNDLFFKRLIKILSPF